MLVMIKKENGSQTVGINTERVNWVEPAADGRSRICFAGDHSVVVDGPVEQVVIALTDRPREVEL